MNKYFWDEYNNLFLDKQLKNIILKFHLSTHSTYFKEKETFPEKYKKQWLNKLNMVIYPDITIKEIDVDNLPKILNNLIIQLKKIFSTLQYKLIFPIITIINIPEMDDGNYCIDFLNNRIMLYSYIEEHDSTNNTILFLTYLINIDDSILLYGRDAYVQSLMQAGYISYSIYNKLKNSKLNINIYKTNMQNWQHKIKINLTKAFISEIYKITYSF